MKEPVRLNTHCMDCLLRGQLHKYPADAEEARKIEYMQKVMEIMAGATPDMSAPVIVRDIYKVPGKEYRVCHLSFPDDDP